MENVKESNFFYLHEEFYIVQIQRREDFLLEPQILENKQKLTYFRKYIIIFRLRMTKFDTIYFDIFYFINLS